MKNTLRATKGNESVVVGIESVNLPSQTVDQTTMMETSLTIL